MPHKPLGRIPSPDDARDRDIRSLLGAGAMQAVLPSRFRVYAASRMGRFDQQESSCVGQSAAFVKIIHEKRDMLRHYPIDPLQLWDRAKQLDGVGNPTSDRGTYIRTALGVLRNEGAALSRTGGAEARFRIDSYYRCHTVADAKAAIFATGPIIIGQTWFNSWFDVGDDGILPEPDTEAGGHATAGYGWNDDVLIPWDGTRGALIAANSWNDDWGKKGDYLIPYSQIGDGKPVDEMWKPSDLVT